MRRLAILAVTLGLALSACGDGSSSAMVPEDELFCLEAPVVTFESFGEGFILENCQACHASGAPDRKGAPENVVFDTRQDIRDFEDRIVERVFASTAPMPPGGGVADDEKQLMDIWLRCYE